MSSTLNDELRPLIDLAIKNPETKASFKAILIVLEQAPDSQIIIETLDQINPKDVGDLDLCNKAADLLIRADAGEKAGLWRTIVDSAFPENVVPITENTHTNQLKPQPHITFESIGGLENVKKQIRRKIINPFQGKKALFERFNRKAGGGVLMYGPPGCGKTMLATALAGECAAHFINVRAADVLDQYMGNSEKRITQIFEEARSSQPAVLFFDEIEALAQRRQTDSHVRVNTIVSALLTEMDGFAEDNDGMLFLGSTNVPWSLDSAFRRPGRFDRTIFVPPPDRIARKFILNKLLNNRPVSTLLNKDKIVEKATGFSGADLSALVDTAIDIAIEESPDLDHLTPLSDDHFIEAFSEVKSTVGEWLSQARSFADYANESGMYDDLAEFLTKYAR